MALNAVLTLAKVQDLLAETKAWGYSEWTVGATTTAAATTAVVAAVTSGNTVKAQHYLDYLTVSMSLVATNTTSVQIKDGSTVIWEAQLAISGPTYYHFDFSKRPLPASAGAALTATVVASLGAGNVQEVMIVGHTNQPVAAFA